MTKGEKKEKKKSKCKRDSAVARLKPTPLIVAKSKTSDVESVPQMDRRRSSSGRVAAAAAAAAEAADEVQQVARVVVGVDDMIHLGELSEASILSNIQSET